MRLASARSIPIGAQIVPGSECPTVPHTPNLLFYAFIFNFQRTKPQGRSMCGMLCQYLVAGDGSSHQTNSPEARRRIASSESFAARIFRHPERRFAWRWMPRVRRRPTSSIRIVSNVAFPSSSSRYRTKKARRFCTDRLFNFGADEKNRTSTPLREQASETCASTSSATSA